MTKAALRDRPFVLVIDETGDLKKGKTTDYFAPQYIGNLGAVDHGIVSVSAYSVLDDVTFPLLFQIFKPERYLKPGDVYQSKPAIAIDLVCWLDAEGFKIKLVLADALYGESGPFLRALEELKLSLVVAIRENHGVLMLPGQRIRIVREGRALFTDDPEPLDEQVVFATPLLQNATRAAWGISVITFAEPRLVIPQSGGRLRCSNVHCAAGPLNTPTYRSPCSSTCVTVMVTLVPVGALI